MLVLIHGLGDRPHPGWLDLVDVPVRVIMPEAPTAHAGGFSWFPYRARDNAPAALAEGIKGAAAQLAHAIEILAAQRPTVGKPIVGGFSQGGMLSYAMAVLHPQLIHAAMPVSGMLPRPLWPHTLQPLGVAPPVRALHGDADTVVAIEPARKLVSHLARLGYDTELQPYPGVGHQITNAMRAHFRTQLRAWTRSLRQTDTPPSSRPAGSSDRSSNSRVTNAGGLTPPTG